MDFQMPCNPEAEASVLGSILIDSSCMTLAAAKLKPDDFHIQAHHVIFDAMLRLNETDVVDAVTVSKALGNQLHEIGGFELLARLAVIVPTTENIKYYIDIVLEKSRRRAAIQAHQDAIKALTSDDDDGIEKARLATDAAVSAIGTAEDGRPPYRHIKDVLITEFECIQDRQSGKVPIGIPTGLNTYDNYFSGGAAPSDLIIIAARPAMGKTSFAKQLAYGISREEEVLFCELEMSQSQSAQRIISMSSLVPLEKIRCGTATDSDWPNMARGVSLASKHKLYLSDRPTVTVSDIRQSVKRLQPKALFVDYLQLMTGGKKVGNREQEIAQITREFKIMAKDFGMTVYLLSQLSRSLTNRADKRPQLSDLRESGAIEQDADIVIFLHREDYYNPETEKKNIAECIVGKNRNGPTGTFELYWHPEYTMFRDIRKDGWNG